MSCLFCKNFAAVEPEDHRKEREARRCSFSCGNKWDHTTAANYVKRHKLFINGYCHLNPAPTLVRCESICSKFEDGFYEWWHIGRPGERDNLHDWARDTMQTYMHGDHVSQQNDQLRQENVTLKAQLKTARKRSAARLARLNKTPKKDAPKPAPVPLRLVAAE